MEVRTICEWLQAKQVSFTRIGGEDRNERFRDFQSSVCKHFGWPSIDLIASRWHDANLRLLRAEDVEANRLVPIRIESGQHPRLLAIDRLLSARESHPCDLALVILQIIDSMMMHNSR